MSTLQKKNSNQSNKNQIKNGGYTVLPNVAPIDRTKFSKKDNKYINCALFLCGYLGVENCRQKRGVVSSEVDYIANTIKRYLEGMNCEDIDIDGQLPK
jgi:hypothetical protein